MGEKFKKARLEAGLSQSQLCKDVVSRNMLSQIESGTAKPSLSTLAVLAQRLQKPVGYFFDQEELDFSGRNQVESAWKAYKAGDIGETARILNSNEDLDKFQDVAVLKTMVLLDLANCAIEEKRYPYAGELLRWARKENLDFPELKRKALLLQGRLEGQPAEPVCRERPSLDEELLLRAEGALEQKEPERASHLLEAVENQHNPLWAMLRGRVYLLQGHFRSAVRYFHQAEKYFPEEAAPFLEQCYRELEDFKQAYYYACRQK